MDQISYEHSLENKRINDLSDNVKIFNDKADLQMVIKFLPQLNLEKTIFLIDIEGDEYNLFTDENICNFNKSKI